MTRREWISGLPICLALFKQGKSAVSDQSADKSRVSVMAQRSFGLHLLRDIVDRRPKENIFISPLSVFLALQMAENGAAGATRTAMRKALALPDLDAAELDASTAALEAGLRLREGVTLAIANALWADRHFTLDAAYVKLCGDIFGARATSLDFGNARAAGEINDWVKTATEGKIPNIVTPDAIKAAAVVLTNAVYFAGHWRSPFPPAQTEDAPFHLTGGGTKNLPMMHQERITGAYRAGANFEAALLYYQQSNIFFYALLPRAGSTPKDVLTTVDVEHLADGPAAFDLDLKLPRFNLDFSAGLADYLKGMGMDIAFHYPEADFSRMGSKEFFISDVIHKTRLEVDEKGTVAAAATGIVMRATAMMRPREVKTLVFDRPFVLFIGDAQTGAVLFAGVIEEP